MLPEKEIHISTQACSVSAADCRAWHSLGAKRVVLSRELTLEEIKAIKANIPEDLEIECFVHGSMCISYSGRCLISNHFVKRDANRGACTQPCRWNYTLYRLQEEKRPDDVPTIMQTDEGSFIFSSKDMCMIEHIPELVDAGIHSFKLEGRVRSAYYTAVVTNTYKMALERYMADPEGYVYDPAYLRELESVSHREYGTGFYFTPPHENANTVTTHGYIREKAFLATAVENSVLSEDGLYDTTFIQRNKLSLGETVEIISPGKVGRGFTADTLRNEKGEAIPSAPHPGMLFKLKSPFPVLEGDIIRGGK
jgi:putative protease